MTKLIRALSKINYKENLHYRTDLVPINLPFIFEKVFIALYSKARCRLHGKFRAENLRHWTHLKHYTAVLFCSLEMRCREGEKMQIEFLIEKMKKK